MDAKRQEIEHMGIAKRNRRNLLFTLQSRGSIRDTGKELFYSPQDAQAQEIALLYAGKKWSKHLAVEKGRILFHSEPAQLRERDRGMTR